MTKWHQRFIDLAQLVASWSKDPSTKVGAVLVDEKHRVLGLGYNGFPRGIADDPECLNHRPTKYALTVHAEANAILNAAPFELDGATIYCTHVPCTGCAKLIIQAGIKTVVVPSGSFLHTWAEEQEKAGEMLGEAGVDLRLPV